MVIFSHLLQSFLLSGSLSRQSLLTPLLSRVVDLLCIRLHKVEQIKVATKSNSAFLFAAQDISSIDFYTKQMYMIGMD
jgi:hypothetical protein